MRFYKLQQLTINVYQHGLPLRMLNTWIKTKFHLTPLPQGSSLTIKCKEWSSNRGVIHWWHLLHQNVQFLYCILRYFAILFSTQKVVKFLETEVLSKLNFNLVWKIRISVKIFLSISMSTPRITNGAFSVVILPVQMQQKLSQLYLYKDLQIASWVTVKNCWLPRT